MEELFSEQIETTTPITEEGLLTLNNKRYYNGEEIKTGDKILQAILVEKIAMNEDIPTLDHRLITLNERHFPLLRYDLRLNKNRRIPVVTLK